MAQNEEYKQINQVDHKVTFEELTEKVQIFVSLYHELIKKPEYNSLNSER